MPTYLVNTHAQPNGDHEVHEANCHHLPAVEHRKYLGHFESCAPAVSEAKKHIRNRTVATSAHESATPAKAIHPISANLWRTSAPPSG